MSPSEAFPFAYRQIRDKGPGIHEISGPYLMTLSTVALATTAALPK
jgi:hypothetical protein